MSREERILPRPDYEYRSSMMRILPRPDYKVRTLHTRNLPAGSMVESIEAEWCPVCLGQSISERMMSGKPVWHCNTCKYEW